MTEPLQPLGPLGECAGAPPGAAAAAALFLLLLTAGAAAAAGLVLYWLKRPVPAARLGAGLAARALPPSTVLLFFLFLAGLYVPVSLLYADLFEAGEVGPHTMIYQTLLLHVPGLLFLGWLLRREGRGVCGTFGLSRRRILPELGLGAVYYLASVPLLWIFNLVCQAALRRFGVEFDLQEIARAVAASSPWSGRVALLLAVVVAAPVFEEAVFRGVLLPLLARRTGFWPAVLLVSFGFGALHLHLSSFPLLVLLSVLLSLAYARTGSLLVPVALHAAFNGITVVLLLLLAA